MESSLLIIWFDKKLLHMLRQRLTRKMDKLCLPEVSWLVDFRQVLIRAARESMDSQGEKFHPVIWKKLADYQL